MSANVLRCLPKRSEKGDVGGQFRHPGFINLGFHLNVRRSPLYGDAGGRTSRAPLGAPHTVAIYAMIADISAVENKVILKEYL